MVLVTPPKTNSRAGVAVAAHHDQVAVKVRRMRKQPLPRRDSRTAVMPRFSFDTVRAQPIRESRRGSRIRETLRAIRIDGGHCDVFRPLEQRKSIRDCTRSFSAAVPANQHPLAQCRLRADRRHDRHGTTRREHDRGDEIVREGRACFVVVALSQDEQIAASPVRDGGLDRRANRCTPVESREAVRGGSVGKFELHLASRFAAVPQALHHLGRQ